MKLEELALKQILELFRKETGIIDPQPYQEVEWARLGEASLRYSNMPDGWFKISRTFMSRPFPDVLCLSFKPDFGGYMKVMDVFNEQLASFKHLNTQQSLKTIIDDFLKNFPEQRALKEFVDCWFCAVHFSQQRFDIFEMLELYSGRLHNKTHLSNDAAKAID